MKTLSERALLSLSLTVGFLALPQVARAQQQAITCNSGGPCFGVTHTANNDSAWGIRVTSFNSVGLIASSSGTDAIDNGLVGEAIRGNGVQGKSENINASGVYGFNTGNGYGVAGRSGAGTGVLGEATAGGWGGIFIGKFAVQGLSTFTGNVHVNGNITASGTITPNNPSDRSLKKNIRPLPGALDKLLSLKGASFQWKDPAKHANQTGEQIGFIAQEVEQVFPEWVASNADGVKNLLHLRSVDALMVESIRTLKTENDRLRARIEALESRSGIARASVVDGPLGLAALLGLATLALLAHALRARRARV
jgi:hypothetical protein